MRFIRCVDGLPVYKVSRLMAGKSEGFALDSKKVILDFVRGLLRPIPFDEDYRSLLTVLSSG